MNRLVQAAVRTTVTTRFVHGPGIDEPWLVEADGQGYAVHADALGSVTGLSDASQTVAEASAYTSFGELSRSGTVAGNGYAYTGREWERELALYYYRARYYDPEVGRFLSRDPIGFAGGDTNLYAYVRGTPMTFTDPHGLYTEIIAWDPLPPNTPAGLGKSAFGHLSLNINGRNYSFGPRGWDTTFPDAVRYAERQQQFRAGRGLVLSLTSDQEAQLAQCLAASRGVYDYMDNNCTTPPRTCLQQLGFGMRGFYPDQVVRYLLNSGQGNGRTFYPGPYSPALDTWMWQGTGSE